LHWPGVAHYRPFLAWTQTQHLCLLPCATNTSCLYASNIGEFSPWVWLNRIFCYRFLCTIYAHLGVRLCLAANRQA